MLRVFVINLEMFLCTTSRLEGTVLSIFNSIRVVCFVAFNNLSFLVLCSGNVVNDLW